MNSTNKPWTMTSKHPSEMDDAAKQKLAEMEAQLTKWNVDPKLANFFSQLKKDSIVACGNCGLNEAELGDSRKLKRCVRCKTIGYCSESCQKADWQSKHRQICCVPTLSNEAQAAHDAAMKNLCDTFTQQLNSGKGQDKEQPTTKNGPKMEDKKSDMKMIPAIQIQDATHPRTEVNPELLRMYRIDNSICKFIVMQTSVCRSYPRWANIGLTPEVKPFKLALGIIVDRRKPNDKIIWILDPTNAHFHEDPAIPWESKIFLDVGMEVMANVGYMIKCECPLQNCTCGDDWRIDFVRCKELPLQDCGYPEIVDIRYPRHAATSLAYHFKQFVNEDTFLEGQKEAGQTYFTTLQEISSPDLHRAERLCGYTVLV
ncbi:uncharacterized protein LOC118436657 [Folsomia candida]|uniref:MYND-type domain-containing protein n=1 Tax=Folsomia candida TaxID=158441 RepID=A0A226DUK7_FOLCA|nr:uncharacterized protein LOC118436657 [Folsomia candida]OXA49185.1 putative protein MSS51, mitochondrial [Folsomia candida]